MRLIGRRRDDHGRPAIKNHMSVCFASDSDAWRSTNDRPCSALPCTTPITPHIPARPFKPGIPANPAASGEQCKQIAYRGRSVDRFRGGRCQRGRDPPPISAAMRQRRRGNAASGSRGLTSRSENWSGRRRRRKRRQRRSSPGMCC